MELVALTLLLGDVRRGEQALDLVLRKLRVDRSPAFRELRKRRRFGEVLAFDGEAREARFASDRCGTR